MKISFILPIRNEESFIEKTIQSVLSQTSKVSQEFIFVDGMSCDNTTNIINNYKKQDSRISIIDNPECIVSTGFNRGLNKTTGEVIIRVDGHSEITPGFLENCLRVLNETQAECVGGPTKHIADGIVGRAITIAQSSNFGVGGAAFRKKIKKRGYVDTLAFGAYRREVFEKFGGYDEELIRNQDDEFNFRIVKVVEKFG